MTSAPDILRLVDSISRDKSIDKEQLFCDLEAAMASAVRKTYGEVEDVTVAIDRVNGKISAACEGSPVSLAELGRISAQTCKQVMIQRIREAERGSIFDEYSQRVGVVVTGTVSRYEGGALVVNLGRTEGFMPRSEQIIGETHHPGDRIRAMVLDVREAPHQVKIVLTRSHPDFIRRLFELEVPEVGERIIEIKALAREAGYRTKVAVSSIDTKVDAVGACVGVRGSRIRNIVDELGGEKIDIVRWNESSQVLISNALKPAEVQETALCFELGRGTVVVAEDQLSLAIGKRGQNVRLAARLTGWDIDILTPAEYNKNLDNLEKTLRAIGVEDLLLDKMLAMGMISLMDVEEVGLDPLVSELEIDAEFGERIVQTAAEEARRLAAEAAAAKAAAEEEAAAEKEATAEEEAEQQSATVGEADTGPGEPQEGVEALSADQQTESAAIVEASEEAGDPTTPSPEADADEADPVSQAEGPESSESSEPTGPGATGSEDQVDTAPAE